MLRTAPERGGFVDTIAGNEIGIFAENVGFKSRQAFGGATPPPVHGYYTIIRAVVQVLFSVFDTKNKIGKTC